MVADTDAAWWDAAVEEPKLVYAKIPIAVTQNLQGDDVANELKKMCPAHAQITRCNTLPRLTTDLETTFLKIVTKTEPSGYIASKPKLQIR